MPINPSNHSLPASASFEKLKAKLRELFELDKADLDFGIYRILHVRHKEIAEFLDKHLEKTVREALQQHSTVHQAQIEEDLHKAELAAKEAGISPEQSPRVLQIREKLHDKNSLDALADELDGKKPKRRSSIENRPIVGTRLIREWNADVVITCRPNDYHPDHRYTSILVQDSA